MRRRFLASFCAGLVLMTALSTLSMTSVHGQASASARDLEGVWANITVTPLERPPELAQKQFFTEEEAREWERQTLARLQGRSTVEARISPDVTGDWLEVGKVDPSRRTSLIVDPPDGRIPVTP